MTTTREFRKSFLGSTSIVSLAAIVFISSYLASLLRLSDLEWRWFFYIVGGLFSVFLLGAQVATTRTYRPILRYLEYEEGSDAASQEELREAYRALSYLPLRNWYSGLFWWTAGGVVVSCAMSIRFDSLQFHSLAMISLAAASGGFVASGLQYFISKSMYRGLLEEMGALLGDASVRRSLSTRVTLRRKLIVSVAGVSFVTVVFGMLLAMSCAGESLERHATTVQAAFLEEAAPSLGLLAKPPHSLTSDAVVEDTKVGASDPADEIARLSERARRLRVASEIVWLDAKSGQVLAGSNSILTESERDWVVRSASSDFGESRAIESPNTFSWIKVAGSDGVVVAVIPWSALRGDLSVTGFFVIMTVVVSGLLSLALAVLLGRDVGSRSHDLKEAVAKLASGDLLAAIPMEIEDEIGEIAAEFEAMAGELRTTVGRIAETTDLVECRSAEIAEITRTVASGADEQSGGVREAVESMDRMNGQATGIASSAQELNMLVEESSSSILEMGAAGDELNDTAGVLSSRVEEVSSSIEQMVRSVKEVSQQTDTLSSVSSETSSSMEEMASAMREVNNIAEAAAKLSMHAVGASEDGREKVRETIEGIELIRAATTTAEGVITGLGERAKEIGSILDVIDDVADETNLLALNAAIIAAQAGEHGRAFSVVADEIKELADRVLSSTKEIGGLIRSVQDESANAVGAIAEGARSVVVGVERSKQAGASLEEITKSSRESGQRILEIVRSVQEQSKAANNVVEMMEKLGDGVQAIHGATEEQDHGNEVVYRSIVAMREVALQLRGTTEEQARGGARIRQSIDGVRDAAESINNSLQAQSSSCAEVVGFLEEVSAGSQANDVSSTRLEQATRALQEQAESLRADLHKFLIDS